jgi:single-strand DNA-binding protein
MNDNTYIGNVTKVERFRETRNGDAEITFTIALNDGYYDKNNRYVELPAVFQRVVAYRKLATNLKETFDAHEKKGVGMGMFILGKMQNDDWTPEGAKYPVRQTKVIASHAGPDLLSAIALVSKVGKTDVEQGREGNRQQLAAVA